MIIDHDKKFVFVAVAKTACTSIHRSFEILIDPPPPIYHMHLKDIINNNPHTKDYFKFGFVRNPYDRLVSAYNDFKNDTGHQSWAFPIQRHATFKDFAMNLHDSPCKEFIHLQPQYDFLDCGGDIVIDFVGRFESLQRDFNTVQKLLGLEVKKLETHRANSHDHYESYYDEESRQAIYKFYKKDFEAFGYEK
jgi:chondroitin 4-sulfotransferase 11